MSKAWEHMTQAEKIEELRADVLKTMSTVNAWIKQQEAVGASHNQLLTRAAATEKFVSGMATALEKLEQTVAASEIGRRQ